MPNGQLTASQLVLIPRGPHVTTNGDQYLSRDALPYFLAAAAEFHQRTGMKVHVAEAYRTLETQIAYFLDRYFVGSTGILWRGQRWLKKAGKATAAVPGTSIHGNGDAVDVWSGIDVSFTATNHRAWVEVAAKYGWRNTGTSFGEPWHQEWSRAWVTQAVAPIGGAQQNTETPAAPVPRNVNMEDDMPRLVRVNEPGNTLNGLVAFLFPDRVIRTGDNKVPGLKGSDQIYRLGRAWGLVPANAKWEDHAEQVSVVEFLEAENEINRARGVARGEYAKDIAAAVWGTLIDVPSLNGRQTAAARVGGIDLLKQDTARFSGQAAKDIAALLAHQGPTGPIDTSKLADAIADALNTKIATAVVDILAARLRD